MFMSHWKKLGMVLIGNLIVAFATVSFLEGSGLIRGGTTGVGKVVYALTGLPVSGTYAVVNGICFFLGLWILGKEFALTTILSSVIFPPMLRALEVLSGGGGLSDDLVLCAVFAGILTGIGIGLVMRAHSSTGGLDIPPLIVNRLFGVPVGVCMMGISIVVVVLQIPFSSMDQILYGLIQIMIMSVVLDKVLMTGHSQAKLWVISSKYDSIKKMLLQNDVGATLFPIETGYTDQNQKAILCVAAPRRLPHIKQLIQNVDAESFVLVDTTQEVLGKGFTLPR